MKKYVPCCSKLFIFFFWGEGGGGRDFPIKAATDSYNPVGIRCQKDVVSTWMRRHHVASILIRCHFYVMCPLGKVIPLKKKWRKTM